MSVVDALCDNVAQDAVTLMFFARDLESLPTPRRDKDIMLLRGASAGVHGHRLQLVAKVGARGKPTPARPCSEFALFDLATAAAIDQAEQATAEADRRREPSASRGSGDDARPQAHQAQQLTPYQVSSKFAPPDVSPGASLDVIERALVLRTARWAVCVFGKPQRPSISRPLSHIGHIVDEVLGLVFASAPSSVPSPNRAHEDAESRSSRGERSGGSPGDAPPPPLPPLSPLPPPPRVLYLWDGTDAHPGPPGEELAIWLDPQTVEAPDTDLDAKTAAAVLGRTLDAARAAPSTERWPACPRGAWGGALAGLLPARGTAVPVEFLAPQRVHLPKLGSWVVLRHLRKNNRGGLSVLEFGPQSSWETAPPDAVGELWHRYRSLVANSTALESADDSVLARTHTLVGSNRHLVVSPTSLPLPVPPRSTLRAVLAARGDPRPRRFLVRARIIRARDGSLEGVGARDSDGSRDPAPPTQGVEAPEPRLELLLEDATGRLVVGVPPGASMLTLLGGDACEDPWQRARVLRELEGLSAISPLAGWGLWCIAAFCRDAARPQDTTTHVVLDTAVCSSALESSRWAF